MKLISARELLPMTLDEYVYKIEEEFSKSKTENFKEKLKLINHKGKAYTLTKSQLADNQIIGKTRVLVENFFGRMKNRYAIIGSLYRGDRENYENIFRLCVALTNFEIMYCKHPLRKEDGEFYAKFTTSDINEMRKKAAEKQKRNGSARRVFDSDSD